MAARSQWEAADRHFQSLSIGREDAKSVRSLILRRSLLLKGGGDGPLAYMVNGIRPVRLIAKMLSIPFSDFDVAARNIQKWWKDLVANGERCEHTVQTSQYTWSIPCCRLVPRRIVLKFEQTCSTISKFGDSGFRCPCHLCLECDINGDLEGQCTVCGAYCCSICRTGCTCSDYDH